MSKLFLKGRRWYEPESEGYSNVLLLHRLYQSLTSPDPPSGPPFKTTTHFAALPAAPGTARPLHSTDAEGVPGVTTFRVSSKERRFVDEVHYKGMIYKLADWVHLANCDDPGRPIIAQIFRCWISEESARRGQPGITVCWYFRPEQVCFEVRTEPICAEPVPSRLSIPRNDSFGTMRYSSRATSRIIRWRTSSKR